MKERPRKLRNRLLFYPPVEGKPPWVLIAFIEHLGVSIARGWLEIRGAESLAKEYPAGAEFLRKATEDAKAHIAALGHSPGASSVDGYLDEIGSWFHYDFNDDALKVAIKAAEDAASAELLARLPGNANRSARGSRTRVVTLSRDGMERWRNIVREIVAIRLWHERAVKARPEYFRLAKARCLPARDIFQDELDTRLRDLLETQTIEKASVERLVGASVARASAWRLQALRWELEVADLKVAPIGSYLNDSNQPRKAQIWRVVDGRLRALLGTSISDLAKSRVLSAALKVYAGDDLAPIADIDAHARNAAEKLRRRMPPGFAWEVRRLVTMEEHPFVPFQARSSGPRKTSRRPKSRTVIARKRGT